MINENYWITSIGKVWSKPQYRENYRKRKRDAWRGQTRSELGLSLMMKLSCFLLSSFQTSLSFQVVCILRKHDYFVVQRGFFVFSMFIMSQVCSLDVVPFSASRQSRLGCQLSPSACLFGIACSHISEAVCHGASCVHRGSWDSCLVWNPTKGTPGSTMDVSPTLGTQCDAAF